MIFSKKTYKIKQSLTRQLFDLAKQYEDVIDLTLGDPDLLPSESIKEAACMAIKNGNTHYSANAGLLDARKAIASFTSKEYSTNISYENIMITVGGMEAIYLLLNSLIDENDEVIIFSPHYVNYIQMTLLCNGNPIVVPFKNSEFSIDLDLLEQKITNRTKVLILNSPNNPTGKVIPKNIIEKIAKIALKNNIFVISDEVYKSLVYTNNFFSIYSIDEMKNNCAVIDSMSKRYSMTGYRLGYIVCNTNLINCLVKLQENIVACAPLPSQYAAIEAYSNSLSNDYVRNEFLNRRNFILERIKNIEKLKLNGIDATFYAFIDISKTKMKSLEFAMNLLKKQHVAVVPGITYGNDCDDYIRLAFTKNIEILKIAFDRIEKFLK